MRRGGVTILFANVNHHNKLHSEKMKDDYMIYTHYKPALEVMERNPKHIKGPEPLARDDIVVTAKDKTWFTSPHHRETTVRLLAGKTGNA